MAFPKRIADITTNLTLSKLSDVVAAVKNNKVMWGHHSMYAEVCSAFFMYKGIRYEMTEWCEEVKALYKVKK